MLTVRCKSCNKEISSHPTQSRSCGCPNMTVVVGDNITARDLSKVVVTKSPHNKEYKDRLSSADLQWQEQRRKRKVRKLNFEVR